MHRGSPPINAAQKNHPNLARSATPGARRAGRPVTARDSSGTEGKSPDRQVRGDAKNNFKNNSTARVRFLLYEQ
jgi:hypothetical protein